MVQQADSSHSSIAGQITGKYVKWIIYYHAVPINNSLHAIEIHLRTYNIGSSIRLDCLKGMYRRLGEITLSSIDVGNLTAESCQRFFFCCFCSLDAMRSSTV